MFLLFCAGCATLAQQRGGLRYKEVREFLILSNPPEAAVYDYSQKPIKYLGITPYKTELYRQEYELLPPQSSANPRKILEKQLMVVYENKAIFKKIDQFTKERTLEFDFTSQEAANLTQAQQAMLKQELIVGMTEDEVEKSIGRLDVFNSKITPSGIKILYVDKIKGKNADTIKIAKILRIKDGIVVDISDY